MNTHSDIAVPVVRRAVVSGQCAALCYRIEADRPEVLLVTSLGSGRWILPKGWPMPGLPSALVAAREAWEEAGVIGVAQDRCLGLYSYRKSIGGGKRKPFVALVFPVRVRALADVYPERGQRRRRWFSPLAAAERVSEPDLADLLRQFDPAGTGL